jgi:hypothetical protein
VGLVGCRTDEVWDWWGIGLVGCGIFEVQDL